MAGKGMLVFQERDFTPDPEIEISRDMKTKKSDWRLAESEVLGSDFVFEQEDRIKKGVLMNEEVRNQLLQEGDSVIFNVDKLKKNQDEQGSK